jgi:hypothetical protein
MPPLTRLNATPGYRAEVSTRGIPPYIKIVPLLLSNYDRNTLIILRTLHLNEYAPVEKFAELAKKKKPQRLSVGAGEMRVLSWWSLSWVKRHRGG